MKKVLSVILAAAMLLSCLAVSTGVMADSLPELSLDGKTTVIVPKNTTDETSVKLARFVPKESGCYVFECEEYKNTPSADELPGGAISVDIIEPDYQSSIGFAFFFDMSKLSAEEIEAYRNIGLDVDHIGTPKFTADLEAGKEYFIVGSQDGTEDYKTDITVAKHAHTLKKGQEEKVKVNNNGTSDETGGIYDTCEDWFCSYINYTTTYYQIEYTKVKDAVYTGKAVKPAVKIMTSSGKKLASKYYTVTYKNNKKIGKGTAVIKFKNGYTGTVKKSFKINPKATAVKKLTAGKKQLKAKYKKVAGVTGYQVQVATNKKFTKNKKTVTVKGAKKVSSTVKKLRGGKKYYVRVRTYKTVSGKKYYSAWSKVKTVKVKK